MTADLNVRKDMQSLASLAASVRPAGEKKTERPGEICKICLRSRLNTEIDVILYV